MEPEKENETWLYPSGIAFFRPPTPDLRTVILFTICVFLCVYARWIP
jgi:hypothetical protein